ncbi:MAG: TonB C-terminal domain-containing protein [Deltaproteobacteria bacterium]|nr:TonB C-terminal domain-containing protein [Deltaproteobacteria bacterium]
MTTVDLRDAETLSGDYYPGRRRGFEPVALVSLIVTVLLHGGALAGVIVYERKQAEATKPPPPRKYVVAKLVRLGKVRKKHALPDKEVPRVSTVKKTGVSYDGDADAKPHIKKKRRDRDAKISDRLRSSFDKAAAFAKIQPDRDVEGSPDGVRGGTAKKASRGDRYMTRIADIWNRTWSLPSIITPGQAKKLYVLVVIKLGAGGKITFPITFDHKSGNAHFDASIRSAWSRIKRLPLPSGDRLASVLANGLALRLTWRGMR